MPPLAEVIAESKPFATVISAALSKPATASENTRVTVAVSPICRALSERVKEFTAGAVASTVMSAAFWEAVAVVLPARSVCSTRMAPMA